MQIKQIRLQKQQVFIIVGFLLIAIAVVLIQLYLDQERRLAMKYAAEDADRKLRGIQESQATVLVASRNIAAGTLIDPDMLGSRIVLGPEKEPRAVTSLARIDGMVATTSINKGEQITLDKVMYPRAKGGLAESTPTGKRAITISVDNVSSLMGMIKPGDYVDVIAMLGIPVQAADGKQVTQAAVIPLFQNVLVLAVGQETAASLESKIESRYKQAEKKESSPLITVALSPQEANLITFVQEQGRIRLVLRSPMDSQTQPIQPASWDTLFQYIMPQQAKVEEAPGDKIEIYRGLNKKDTISLSQ